MSAPPPRRPGEATPATRTAPRRRALPTVRLCLLLATLLACATPAEIELAKPDVTSPKAATKRGAAEQVAAEQVAAERAAAERARIARRSIAAAHQLIAEGRIEHALSWTQRGLDAEPNDTELLRLHAEVLERLGRPEEGAPFRVRADALDPTRPSSRAAPYPCPPTTWW